MGFRVWGLGFSLGVYRVWGLRFGAWLLGFRAYQGILKQEIYTGELGIEGARLVGLRDGLGSTLEAPGFCRNFTS